MKDFVIYLWANEKSFARAHNVFTEEACESYSWNGTTYTTSGIRTFGYTNAFGCASVDTLYLTINYSNSGTDVITACDSYTWIDGNTYTASNNTATFILTNAAGCDSTATLHLTVYPVYNMTASAEIFQGDSIYLEGAWQSVAGIYSDTYATVNGYDSTVNTTLAVLPGSHVFGTITYDNDDATPMNNVWVYLLESGVVVDSALTDADGEYSIPVFNGNYTIIAITDKPWNEVNSTDALLVQQHYTGLQLLAGNRLTVADVNLSTYINSADALLIKRRFVGLDTSFATGDWYLDPEAVVINGADAEMNFKALCFGDVNASYVPPSAKTNGTVDLISPGTLSVTSGDIIDIPVSVANVLQTGAVSLIFTYPQEIEVVSVTAVAVGMTGLITNIANGKVFVAWNDLQALNLQEDDILLTLQVRVLADNGSEIAFGLLPESEFADETAQVITGVTLYAPSLVPAPTGVTTVDIDEISIYPNPTYGKVYISNAAESEISITDVLGRKIYTTRACKSKIKSIDLSKYREGTYIVKIVKSDKVVTKKLVVKK